MDKQVIGLSVTVISLVVTYKVSAVMVIVKLVGVTARILHEGGVVERVMVADTVYVKEVVIDIDHLKTAELTSGREYQLAAVLIGETVAGVIGGSGVDDHIVRAAVLHDHGVELLGGIPYRKVAVIDLHIKLLLRI